MAEPDRGIDSVLIERLLELIQVGERAAYNDLVQLLADDFHARIVRKRFFPISVLREACRRHLRELALGQAAKLTFYRCASDAILSAMASSSISDVARVGQALRDMVLVLDDSDPGKARLLSLHYIAGLDWNDIAALAGGGDEPSGQAKAAQELVAELKALGVTQDVLEKQHLTPRGKVTRLLEDVRDGRRPLGDVVVSEREKLQRQAEHLLRLEGRNISLQADDLVNEMFVRMPRTPEKSPVNHLEFEALAKRIMRHILIDRARKPIPGQSKISTELSEDSATSPALIEQRLLMEKVVKVANEVLDELRQTDRETAEMLHAALFGFADQRELARLHAVSVSTVKRRLKDARERIRRRLDLE